MRDAFRLKLCFIPVFIPSFACCIDRQKPILQMIEIAICLSNINAAFKAKIGDNRYYLIQSTIAQFRQKLPSAGNFQEHDLITCLNKF